MAEDVRSGLWPKQSKSGNTYLNGSVTLDGKKYWISGFTNDDANEQNRKPDMNLIFKLDSSGDQSYQAPPPMTKQTDDVVPF